MPPARPRVPIRILVCDEQVLVRAGYVSVFGAQQGVEVVGETESGLTLVEEATRLRPDVVVMDLRLPDLDGIEVIRRLAGPGVADPVKVLVVTTVDGAECVHETLRAGADGFLPKHTPPDEMVSAVRKVAVGEVVLAPSVTRRLIGRFATRIRQDDPAIPPAGQRLGALTQRELQVLKLAAFGMSNAEIAATMVIGHETVKTYMSRVLAKLGVRDRVHAVIQAYRTGLVAPGD